MSSFERIGNGNKKEKIYLTERIAGGGAADIFKIKEFSDEVAKIYKSSQDLRSYEKKVRMMIDFNPCLPDFVDPLSKKKYPLAAWPRALIIKRGFKGFTMPKINLNESTTMQRLLQSSMRRHHGLNQALWYRLAVARNLCALISTLNKMHYYIIDLKPLNLQVYKKNGNIVLLDCDGISMMNKSQGFTGTQVTPDYTAPENFGKKAANFDEIKCQRQERFALAVIIFQLLNNGLHPFSFLVKNSKYAGDILENIKDRRYVYDRKKHKWGSPNPQSIHESFTDELRDLFDSAFTSIDRPSPHDWFLELDKFVATKDKSRFKCKNNADHFNFGKGCGECAKHQINQIQLNKINPPLLQNADTLIFLLIKNRTPSFLFTFVTVFIGFLLLIGIN